MGQSDTQADRRHPFGNPFESARPLREAARRGQEVTKSESTPTATVWTAPAAATVSPQRRARLAFAVVAGLTLVLVALIWTKLEGPNLSNVAQADDHSATTTPPAIPVLQLPESEWSGAAPAANAELPVLKPRATSAVPVDESATQSNPFAATKTPAPTNVTPPRDFFAAELPAETLPAANPFLEHSAAKPSSPTDDPSAPALRGAKATTLGGNIELTAPRVEMDATPLEFNPPHGFGQIPVTQETHLPHASDVKTVAAQGDGGGFSFDDAPLEISPIPPAKPSQPSASPFEPQPLPAFDPQPVESSPNAFPAAQPSQPESSAFEPGLLTPAAGRQASDYSPSAGTLPTEDTVHQVQVGENYWTISKQHYDGGRYFAALARYNMNRIPDPERLKPGMYVLVPDLTVLQERFPTEAGVEVDQAAERADLPSGFFLDENGQPMYRVGEGDTLGEIAQKHLGRASRWIQIQGMNQTRLGTRNILSIGTVLHLPADASQVMEAP